MIFVWIRSLFGKEKSSSSKDEVILLKREWAEPPPLIVISEAGEKSKYVPLKRKNIFKKR